MAAETGTVYVLIDPRFDEVRYVGATTRSLATRLAGHRSHPSPKVRPWIRELAEEGLIPEVRPTVEDVPAPDLASVEYRQIVAHHEAGSVLLNVDGLPRRDLYTVKECQAFVDRCRNLGASALAIAAARLAEALVRREQNRQWNAEMRERQQRLYPDDPARQHDAIMTYVRIEGPQWERELPPDGWEQVCTEAMAVAATLKPHGYSFKDIVLSKLFEGVRVLPRPGGVQSPRLGDPRGRRGRRLTAVVLCAHCQAPVRGRSPADPLPLCRRALSVAWSGPECAVLVADWGHPTPCVDCDGLAGPEDGVPGLTWLAAKLGVSLDVLAI